MLEELGLINPKTDIILELATESNVAAALNPSKESTKSIIELLQPDRHIHQLGSHFKGVAAPIVLAPSTPAPLNTLLSALALVNTDVSAIEKAVVLVHINDAPQFTLAYSLMDYFSIAWDVADYPTANLAALAQLLVTEQHLTEQSWRGIQLCHHKQRHSPDSEERTAILNQLMDEFSFVRAV